MRKKKATLKESSSLPARTHACRRLRPFRTTAHMPRTHLTRAHHTRRVYDGVAATPACKVPALPEGTGGSVREAVG